LHEHGADLIQAEFSGRTAVDGYEYVSVPHSGVRRGAMFINVVYQQGSAKCEVGSRIICPRE
jgi:hypothetical protein